MNLTTDISNIRWFRTLCLIAGIFFSIFGILEFIEVAKGSVYSSYKFAVASFGWGMVLIFAALKKRNSEVKSKIRQQWVGVQNMKRTTNKTYQAVSFSYALMACGFIGIAGFTISLLGWHGIDQFLNDMKMFYASLVPIVIFSLLNAVMAFLSWGFLGHSKNKKRVILGSAILLLLLPTYSLVLSVFKGAYEPIQVVSILIVASYSIQVFCLARGMNSNQ